MILLLGERDRIWLRVAADAISATARRDGLRPPPWVDDLEVAASAGPTGTMSPLDPEAGDSQVVPLVYRPEEAAEVLRVSPRTVSRLIAAGELRAFKVFNDRWIARTDLLAFMDRQRAAS